MKTENLPGDALIEVLHAAQQRDGYLSPPLLEKIARDLKLPPSKVLGVATFYHLFRSAPPRDDAAVVCMGTACYIAGAPELKSILGSAGYTVEIGRCVGSCGLAPVVLAGGKAFSRVCPQALPPELRGKGSRP